MPRHASNPAARPRVGRRAPVVRDGSPAPFDSLVALDGTARTEAGLPPGLSATAARLLGLWLEARDAWAPAARLFMLEAVLLTAHYRDLRRGLAVAAEAQPRDVAASTIAAVERLSQALPAWHGSVVDLLETWTAASACPRGRGALPLHSLRPDLPLLDTYRQLSADARLVLFAMAHTVGHRTVLTDASVYAARVGLQPVPVRRALDELTRLGWVIPMTDLAPLAATMNPRLFTGLAAGPWGWGATPAGAAALRP